MLCKKLPFQTDPKDPRAACAFVHPTFWLLMRDDQSNSTAPIFLSPAQIYHLLLALKYPMLLFQWQNGIAFKAFHRASLVYRQLTNSGRYEGFLCERDSRLQCRQLGVRFIFAVTEVKKHSKSRASPSRSIDMIANMAPIPCNFGSEMSLQIQLFPGILLLTENIK